MTPLRPIVITGASGFLGLRTVRRIHKRRPIIVLDRRLPSDPADYGLEGVRWHQIDLADAAAVAEIFREIRESGGAESVLHLAAYYDFTGEDHPEYRRTNVDALRLVLEGCRGLGLRRFVFASSVAACPFPPPGTAIDESWPPTGDNVYAVSKRIGEQMLGEYAADFPSCIVRFAALFSDWCEYPPLYFFLETWLSDRWNARILGGRGQSAIPFLHVRDAADFLDRVLARPDTFADGEVLQCSPDGSTTHQELYDAATAYALGERRPAIHMPKALCGPGMWLRDQAGRLLGARPFERPWMARYVDLKLHIDARRTRERLGWSPHPRLEILARIPFMIENSKADPVAWYRRNQEALDHLRLIPDFQVYRLLARHRTAIEERFEAFVAGVEGGERLPHLRALGREERAWQHAQLWRSLEQSVRARQKATFMAHCRDLAQHGQARGFTVDETVHALRTFGRICAEAVRGDPEGAHLDREIKRSLTMTIEFGIDQAVEVYEQAAERSVRS